MTTGPLVLVLIAALAHALWNLASTYATGDTFLFVWSYTAVSAALCLLVTVALPFSRGDVWSWRLTLAAFVSAALHVVYSLVLQRGYQQSDVGLIYPVARGTGPLLTLIVAIAVLGERPGVVATLGALVIIAGVVVVIGNPFARGASPGPLLWGVATGASIAAYTLWDSYSIATPSRSWRRCASRPSSSRPCSRGGWHGARTESVIGQHLRGLCCGRYWD